MFGKKSYKEAQLAASQETMVKEYAQAISSIKATMVELMKTVEAVEKEHAVENQSVSIKFFTYLSMYIFTH